MMKWVEIATKNSIPRMELLSDFLKKAGKENSVEFIQSTSDDLSENIIKATNEYDLIRIGAGLGEAVVKHFPFSSERVRMLQTADCLVPIGGKWWSRSATYHGLQRVLNYIGQHIDLDSYILIAGVGAISRAVIAAFVKMGFTRFNVTNQFGEQALTLIEELSKSYFGVEFNFIPASDLVMLPGVSGVVVNTTPYRDDNELLKELYYFNFLKPGGIVIDFVLEPKNTPLVQEARAIEAQAFEGFEIASWADVIWSRWCFGIDIDHKGYERSLCDILESCPPIQSEEELDEGREIANNEENKSDNPKK